MVFFRCYSTFLHIFISHLLGWLHCPARLLTRSVLGRRPSIHAHCRFLFRPAFSWLVHVSHFFFSPFLASAGGGAGWGDGSVSRLVEREGGDRRGGGGGEECGRLAVRDRNIETRAMVGKCCERLGRWYAASVFHTADRKHADGEVTAKDRFLPDGIKIRYL